MAIDANLPLYEVCAMEDRLFESVAQPRFRMALLGAFAALALVMAVVGLAPAFQASRRDATAALKDGGRGLTAGARRNRLRSALVVVEIALASVLLICLINSARDPNKE